MDLVITVGAWVALPGWMAYVVVRDAWRDHQARQLRDIGDTDWEADEVRLWRCGVDPAGIDPVQELEYQLLLPDATPGAW